MEKQAQDVGQINMTAASPHPSPPMDSVTAHPPPDHSSRRLHPDLHSAALDAAASCCTTECRRSQPCLDRPVCQEFDGVVTTEETDVFTRLHPSRPSRLSFSENFEDHNDWSPGQSEG
ncbi:hypothetical protein CTA2_2736 [Colletotrichum tanaceti]|uniref:Uncharacterized protein n=1 Tax=Colletotrichum tanaceti TaxID=1306861 RepID=A0A4U6X0J9_9PEZI|nr:hypothetical protein CTA2_2736 [Colletotrichum tanaceti]TKW48403.1 hypothetical protein CTA1_9353 [Colletotrichum tanaceti]